MKSIFKNVRTQQTARQLEGLVSDCEIKPELKLDSDLS